MSDDAVRPALTPEVFVVYDEEYGQNATINAVFTSEADADAWCNARLAEANASLAARGLAPLDRPWHSVAEVPIYGLSCGFTREDVALALAAAAACLGDDHHIAAELGEDEWTEGRDERFAAKYRALAARIESKLPPEL
jgi:hypothetical protein